MKEFMTIIGFGAGLITGALIYKHSQEAKQLVNKSEKAVKNEIEMMKNKVEPKIEKAVKNEIEMMKNKVEPKIEKAKKDMKKEMKKMAEN